MDTVAAMRDIENAASFLRREASSAELRGQISEADALPSKTFNITCY